MNNHLAEKTAAASPALEVAFGKAGVAPPSNMSKVWTWLSDHPHNTSTSIRKALGMTNTTIYGVLAEMAEREMVAYKMEPERPSSRRKIRFYSAVGRTFAVLPRRAGAKAAAPAAAHAPGAPMVGAEVEKILAQTSILLARELYRRLHEMFGNK
jgi:hypothetical protein